ncbi:hypothetical protein N7481_007705 [Penicillium waksmanii]|uniref:uncharacterized protein n=1 Tax=Penicillium waksmanii TaxID=69791 RepID=UPI0025491DDA|nr:uncharacterized protein N7481_007705 [Penicillium waksmanii]KAJ5980407.1 hypothetical protein N7481_007705 [Penicillium waksmanii]
MSNPASYDSNRRSAIFGRTPEELHIPSTGLINPNPSRQPPQDYPTTPDASAAAQVPSINVHSSQSQHQQLQQPQLQYGGNPGNPNSALPGSLTPGNQHRPTAVSVNTAPSVIPTLQQQPSAQQASHRTSMINSHGHSRSSPAGFDQSVYKQHGGMEGSKYPTSPGGYTPPDPAGLQVFAAGFGRYSTSRGALAGGSSDEPRLAPL